MASPLPRRRRPGAEPSPGDPRPPLINVEIPVVGGFRSGRGLFIFPAALLRVADTTVVTCRIPRADPREDSLRQSRCSPGDHFGSFFEFCRSPRFPATFRLRTAPFAIDGEADQFFMKNAVDQTLAQRPGAPLVAVDRPAFRRCFEPVRDAAVRCGRGEEVALLARHVGNCHFGV